MGFTAGLCEVGVVFASERVASHELRGVLVCLVDVLLEFGSLNPPLASAAYFDRPELAAAH
jgi:hypothetical protein